jgi:hypothetical protein
VVASDNMKTLPQSLPTFQQRCAFYLHGQMWLALGFLESVPLLVTSYTLLLLTLKSAL